MKTIKDQVREAAEASFETFIRLVTPTRVLGSVHSEMCNFLTRSEAKSHQLLLLPRDHQKSAIAGYYAAWRITTYPAIKILYLSSTANLATKQLKFIKDILTSDIYRFYWPEMVGPDEGKREKWTETEISVDHPMRRAESIRDPTVFTGGLTTVITGLHCDLQILDDVVVKENAYTEEGRRKVEEQYSLLASIGSGDFKQVIVGTRYHPKDLYNAVAEIVVEDFDEEGELLDSYSLYETFEKQVEDRGDGSGQFLWPRQQRTDGKWFGFDKKILAKKKAQYLDQVQFRAQYYNDPNDPEAAGIKRDDFQYYDRSFLTRRDGHWFFKGFRLNVFASIDFAYTLGKRSDYTCIAVVGIDASRNYYVLEIDRFKTGDPSEYFKHILQLHQKWDFRKLRAEVTAAQEVIVNDLKQNYIRVHGLALSVDAFRPTRAEGTKKERVAGILRARYQNKQIWHYQGGNCQSLEEELLLSNPPHDDCKDSLASCIDVCVAPTFMQMAAQTLSQKFIPSRFGGFQ